MSKSKYISFFPFLLSILLQFQLYSKGIIEVEELNELLGKKNVKIIDVRTLKNYQRGHIPGAIHAWRPDFADTTQIYRGLIASKQQMESLLGRMGIIENDQVVIYDGQALVNAARLWWVLKYYGFENVQLLNGEIKAWKKAGFKLTKQETKVTPGKFIFHNEVNSNLHADKNDILQILDSKSALLIDVRSPEEFLGEKESKLAKRNGRIPGSINIDWIETINSRADHRFKTPKELSQLFAVHGVTEVTNVVCYGLSGARSAHTVFVLTEILNFPNVKNYDGSWIEWSYFNDLPIENGALQSNIVQETEVDLVATVNYIEVIKNAYSGYAQYFIHEISHPSWHNYFYWLLGLSLLFFLLEILFPWRKDQAKFRKDFWLDAFYMFFNFFLFSLIIFNAASEVVVEFFNSILLKVGIPNLIAFEVQTWPIWAHLLLGFIVRDFVQWWIHRLLHRSKFLWQFHKVHHSVKEMGFAAHLRFHWMENVVYRTLEYIPLALIGIGLTDFFIIHIFTLAIGHWNHSNLKFNLGPLKYIFNNPQMHIWHHSHDLPKERKYGVNFGLTLSIWDYLFKTNYIPRDGRDILLGFPGDEKFPDDFIHQNTYGIIPKDE